ncbi:MAG: glycosyltransferase family 39 protein [Daejeonella sp.]|uniref:ArnT family glycosyltransferase n=1 Tax=Daejeonella sp. TaxID=2805397 RepID=UPI00273699E8|nr:glycosyltransferase family 39 protein [Daejeonella sp.]MDP3467480.1 glycosyltransferase family 39 protein [Daejeonella sp.]
MEKLNLKTKGFLLFIISLVLLLQNLDKPMIYILDEAKNAECAREMLVSGNYIMPYFNGQLRTDKPPLHYFFMAMSYKVFGVSAFSARFFSAIFGALTILISFLFCRRYLGEKAGWLTALVLISSLHFNFQMRMSVPDPYLIFFMTASFMCFYNFLIDKKKFWILLMYLCFGLGLLTKGPIAVALPGLIMLTFLLWTKRLNWVWMRLFQIPAGIIIVLLISLPWYWLNYLASDGLWTEGFFFKHNLQRFSDTMEGHGGFFLLPLIMVIAGLLPLGIFCIQAMFLAWKQRENEILLYSLSIVLGIIIFFSFSQTKLPNYTAPSYPFIAILLGFLLSELEGMKVSMKKIKLAYVFYTIIAFVLPFVVYFVLKADKSVQDAAGVWVWFLPLPLGAVFGWYFIRKNELNKFIFSMAFSFILSNFLFFAKAYPRVYGINPVAGSLELLKNKPDLVYYKMMNSAYVFNMQRLVPAIHSQDSLSLFLNEHPDVLVISRKQFEKELEAAGNLVPVFEQKDTFENPVTVIYKSGR